MKYVVFLGDGMADYPIEALGGKTPLEAASHPVMDRLARDGRFGLTRTIPEGMPKGSDVANLSVMGYDPRTCYSGRSPFEAVSIGIDFSPEDVTYRCNLVTLSETESADDATMIDYSAGEISAPDAAPFIDAMNERFASDTVRFYKGVSYRHCLVLKNAATGAKLTPPHDISGRPVKGCLPSGVNGELLRDMIEYSYAHFKDHPMNGRLRAAGSNPVSSVWFWGEGRKPALTSFYEKYGIKGGVISAVDLVHGLGKCAGLRVIHVDNVTGNYHTDFDAKGRAAIEALSTDCDFVYIHVEAPDECGHHGELKEKIWSIEQIDSRIMAPVMEYLDSCGEDYAVLTMPDHPTPISILTHAGDPVPYALYRKGDSNGADIRFTEKFAEAGHFVENACTLMDEMMGKS